MQYSARQYAESLLGTIEAHAEGRAHIASILLDLATILKVAEIRTALTSPAVSSELRPKIAMLLLKPLKVSTHYVKPLANLIAMIAEANDLSLLPRIAQFIDPAARPVVTLAHEDAHIAPKLHDVTGTTPTMSTDPAIIGGFILRSGDNVIDASIAHELQKMRAALTK